MSIFDLHKAPVKTHKTTCDAAEVKHSATSAASGSFLASSASLFWFLQHIDFRF